MPKRGLSFLAACLCLVLGITLSPCAIHGQQAESGEKVESRADRLAAAMARLKLGSPLGVDIDFVKNAGAAQAVLPDLEKAFGQEKDLNEKTIIASALVKLGDNEKTYWDFLLEQATLALDSDIPDAGFSPSQKKMVAEGSPELLAWAMSHHVDMNTAGVYSIRDFPGKVLLLGTAEDPRGIPVLRRALQARDFLIVMMAAKGLAQLQDKDSIPLIIAACEGAPKGYDAAIAEAALLFFDDPRAQNAVDKYADKQHARVIRDARSHGLKPLGY